MLNPLTNWIVNLKTRYRQSKLTTPEETLNIFKNGVREVDEGRYEKAIKYFTEAISRSPQSAKIHHYRADSYAMVGDYEKAVTDYDIAVRLNPSYPDTYLDRGNSHYQLNQFESALKDFSEAIRLKPDWGDAHANRAVIHTELGNTVESKCDAITAITFGVNEAQLNEMLHAAQQEADS